MPAYSFKKRFVAPIKVGLGIHVAHEPGDAHVYVPKRQTIRAIGRRRHARPGETIQLYTAMRTKQCFKIGDGRCTSVSEIVIAFSRSSPNTNTMISIDGAARYTGAALDDFARLDGFQDWNDMLIFWQDEHGISKPFRGLLIEWEPMP